MFEDDDDDDEEEDDISRFSKIKQMLSSTDAVD